MARAQGKRGPASQRANRITEILGYLLKGTASHEIHQKVRKKYDIGQDQCSKDITEAYKQLRVINRQDREEMRDSLSVDFKRLAKKSETAKQYYAAKGALDSLARIHGAFEPEQVEYTDKTTEKLLAKIDPDKLIETVFGIVEK